MRRGAFLRLDRRHLATIGWFPRLAGAMQCSMDAEAADIKRLVDPPTWRRHHVREGGVQLFLSHRAVVGRYDGRMGAVGVALRDSVSICGDRTPSSRCPVEPAPHRRARGAREKRYYRNHLGHRKRPSARSVGSHSSCALSHSFWNAISQFAGHSCRVPHFVAKLGYQEWNTTGNGIVLAGCRASADLAPVSFLMRNL